MTWFCAALLDGHATMRVVTGEAVGEGLGRGVGVCVGDGVGNAGVCVAVGVGVGVALGVVLALGDGLGELPLPTAAFKVVIFTPGSVPSVPAL